MAPQESRAGARPRPRADTNSGTGPGAPPAPMQLQGSLPGLWSAPAAGLPALVRRRGAGGLEATDQSEVPAAGPEGDWEIVTEAEVEADAEAETEAAAAAEQPESGGGGGVGLGGAGDAVGGEGGAPGAGDPPLGGAGGEDPAMPRDAGGQPLGDTPGGPGDAMDVSGPTPTLSDLVMGPAPPLAPAPLPLPLALPAPGASSAEEGQSKEDSQTGSFRWCIEGFSKNTERKLYSNPPFMAGGYSWRILIFPKGNQMNMEQPHLDQLSLYLDVADAQSLPLNWSRFAKFTLAVINQKDPTRTIIKDSSHQFNARESDWGFTQFMPLSEVYDPGRGFLVDDCLVVEATVSMSSGDTGLTGGSFWSYDSKKETGMVGLKNQGATCYMNSLLQTLFHIPVFRKAVYHMPTAEMEGEAMAGPGGGTIPIPVALQGLFYRLQYSEQSVATKELTKSFGWDTYDSFMQHDVQELNRVLCEKLEDKMKGTPVEGTIELLFEGHIMNYIQCMNVDYKSTRKESFYDLQLDVKGCKDVYESFDKYVEVEMLDGDNKYHAEQHGLQDAKKGVLFLDFPPVLQLQLKRFEYDFIRDTMVKINDRYEFPEELDLDVGDGKYLAKDEPEEKEEKGKGEGGEAMETEGEGAEAGAQDGAPKKGKAKLMFDRKRRHVRNLYKLHSGGVHGGHYYAFIRPDLKGQWYKFDDERVTKEDTKKALDDQFGGEEEIPRGNVAPGMQGAVPPMKFTKYSNAYMLVYIRECDAPHILCRVDQSDIAEQLQVRLKKEQEEKERKRKEKAEAHLYTIIKLAREEDIRSQIGSNIFFELLDWDADSIRTFRIPKTAKFSALKEEVEKELGIPAASQRFWTWARRENQTFRPSRPLVAADELIPVAKLKDLHGKAPQSDLKLFLEHVPAEGQLAALSVPGSTMLFLKLYDPYTERLSYVGRLHVKDTEKPEQYLEQLCSLAGFPSTEEILIFEEIKFEPLLCEPVDLKLSFKQSQLGDGDILCYQRAAPVLSGANGALDGAAEQPQAGGGSTKMSVDAQGPATPSKEGPEGTPKFVPPRHKDVPAFFEYIRNRQMVHFRRLEKPKENEFVLELSKQSTYDEVVEAVAKHLSGSKRQRLEGTPADAMQHDGEVLPEAEGAGEAQGPEGAVGATQVDPACIRLTAHNSYLDQPKPAAFKYRGVDRLSEMLQHYKDSTDTLYFEVLDIPLPELQRLKALSVVFHNTKAQQVEQHSLRLLRESTIAQVIDALRPKLSGQCLTHPMADIRVLQVFQNKIFKVFPLDESIDNINDTYWTLRAEEVPEPESAARVEAEAGANMLFCHHVNGPGVPAPGDAAQEDKVQQEGLKDEEGDGKRAKPAEAQVPLRLPGAPVVAPARDAFGDPFLVLLKAGDTVASLRSRIQEKLGVFSSDFDTWRLGVMITTGNMQYLDDPTAQLAPFFQNKPLWDQFPCIALEHPDTSPKRPLHSATVAPTNRYTWEKPVRILN